MEVTVSFLSLWGSGGIVQAAEVGAVYVLCLGHGAQCAEAYG